MDEGKNGEEPMAEVDILGGGAEEGGAAEDGEEEVFAMGEGGSAEDNRFDEIVGVMEEVLMDASFVEMQSHFCHANCDVFEDTEENKLEYTEIFQEYTQLIENFLEKLLADRIDDFSMEEFERMLVDRRDEVSSDIFSTLIDLGDFSEFKQLMLSHKQAKFAGPETDLETAIQAQAVCIA